MNANHSPGTPVSDADLIRYLDGELDAEESERIETAIAGDDSVAGRLSVLSRRDRQLSALLRSVDPSEEATRAADPSRRVAGTSAPATDISRGVAGSAEAVVVPIGDARADRTDGSASRGGAGVPWLKAAVIVFALMGASLLVPPVRAWIVDRLESIGGGTDPGIEASPPVSPVEGAAVSYGIPITGAVLEVMLDAAQAAGELIIESADVATARIEPLDATAGDPLVITPDAVRIDNGAASAGGYRLTVPRSVTSVRVRFGDGAARSWDVGPDPLTIPLTGAGV